MRELSRRAIANHRGTGQAGVPAVRIVDKSPEYHLEAALRVLGRKLRDWWLLSYDELQFGN
jgi:hypothetical protein